MKQSIEERAEELAQSVENGNWSTVADEILKERTKAKATALTLAVSAWLSRQDARVLQRVLESKGA